MISDISKFTTTCVVLQHSVNGEVIWLETMLMRRIGVTNAKRSQRYRDAVRTARNQVDLQIVATGDRDHCEAYVKGQPVPYAMQTSRVTRKRHRAIKRLSDGQIFGNATQCALENGIGKGSLSKHLNLVHGYDRIKDRWGQFQRFRYLDTMRTPIMHTTPPSVRFPVTHEATGIDYYDMAAIEAVFNIDERTLAAHITGQAGYETIGPHRFKAA